MPLIDPALQRRRLREQLRRLRESKHLTQRAVADELEWSHSKIIRIEAGTVGISITDLRALLALYEVADAAQVDAMVSMARAAKERPWWDRYKNSAPQAFVLSIAYENAAAVIRNFEPDLVPGLLQTEEYAREVLRWTSPPDQLEERAELRLERQERLFRPDGPEMHFIVDEGVLARTVGRPGVMRRQLVQLRELADHPKITLRVIPFHLGLYRYFTTSYVIYEFAEADEDMALYLETQARHKDAIVREGRDSITEDSVAHYLENFYELEIKAPAPDAYALIEANAERIGHKTGVPAAGGPSAVSAVIPLDGVEEISASTGDLVEGVERVEK
ncbi:helix-turn-helix domain-containing protein [Streptomyces fructofermentans]|uniref:helix-turn-helix domain-containing protein n=1 Tax=Streptomyces fructofermentans TaxID=152141 RepID=UPI0033D0E117